MSQPRRPVIPLDPDECREIVASSKWVDSLTVADNGCWHLNRTVSTTGYARICVGGRHRTYRAARVALVAALGRDLREGFHAGHVCHDEAYALGLCIASGGAGCDHRLCVNPAHLEEQASRANVLAGGTVFAVNARKEFCVRGHPLTGPDADLVPNKYGRRDCRPCNWARHRERKESVA